MFFMIGGHYQKVFRPLAYLKTKLLAPLNLPNSHTIDVLDQGNTSSTFPRSPLNFSQNTLFQIKRIFISLTNPISY